MKNNNIIQFIIIQNNEKLIVTSNLLIQTFFMHLSFSQFRFFPPRNSDFKIVRYKLRIARYKLAIVRRKTSLNCEIKSQLALFFFGRNRLL